MFARRYTAINIWTGKLQFELNLQIDDFNTEGVLVGQRLIGSSFGGELFWTAGLLRLVRFVDLRSTTLIFK